MNSASKHMALKVTWLRSAEADLREIYDWIADRANPVMARHYTRRIEEKCNGLGEFPRRGTPRDHLEPGLRSITFERRIIVAYRVEQDRVLILRLIRSARDIEAQFHPS